PQHPLIRTSSHPRRQYSCCTCSSFVFTAPAPTEIYTLSLHDALPIYRARVDRRRGHRGALRRVGPDQAAARRVEDEVPVVVARVDRKSTRLNSSHVKISYAVFCLKKKKKTNRRESGDGAECPCAHAR